ncbi:hypothetical protein IVA80_10930 [Bradyrhizobium sp. 139]|uniref:hypothetical protein n=1 Tax=Bradyrhizobium sp. 139 TaxID=2782616 RepID=UPI001FF9F03A|nr:hypothetical protein [Bradyrhizobium sp. 139]MCK1741364.1 hypothetical protein [Bradyrhizobium sp. 139]
MVFAFNPDNGPARIIRFVDVLTDNVVAVLDKKQNVLTIVKAHYECLTSVQQHRLLRTHDPVTLIHDVGHGDYLLAA